MDRATKQLLILSWFWSKSNKLQLFFSTNELDLKTSKTLIDRSGWCVPVFDGDKNTTGMLEPDWISSLAPKVNWCWVSEMNAPSELYLSGNTVVIME